MTEVAPARSPSRPTDAVALLRRDAYASVWSTGDRAVTAGAALGIAVALLSHGMGLARAFMQLTDMMDWLSQSRREIATYYYESYDVELPPEPDKAQEKPEEKPPEQEPEPEPEPEPTPLTPPPDAPPPDDPYKDAPPPAPAAAPELLTAKADDPLDFSEDGFVTGKGPGGIGYVSSDGQAKEARNPAARPGGVPGGTGTGNPGPPPAPAGKDLSRPPTIAGSSAWNCPFPPEADAAQVDQAVAVIVVTVRPDGTPQSVQVVSDPGSGFGRAARTCALGRRYKTGLDRTGQPTTSATPPIRVRFTR